MVGATGSIGLMLHVGRRNPSRVLLVLFAMWVLSPFVGLALAASGSQRWLVAARERVHVVMVIVALASLDQVRIPVVECIAEIFSHR